jgi:cyclopropane fatty-acyl-phospholipid synthase-like methyltransferase
LEPRLKNGVDLKKIEEICITPYINEESTILEIGTNGGAWLKRMMKAKKLIGTDVLSSEHTGFFKNVPKSNKIKYFQVNNFSCDELDNDSITYLFSYDVFCHISFSSTKKYLKNLYPKLKNGADCFIMIADTDKYTDQDGRNKLMISAGFADWDLFINDYDGDPVPGRWYFYGIDRFCSLLNKYNYKIVSKDVIGKYDIRSPIIHFTK